MDTVGNKQAKAEIAMIKVRAHDGPKVIDWSIQAHGGGGVSQDFKLTMYSSNRVMRIVDGPDRFIKHK